PQGGGHGAGRPSAVAYIGHGRGHAGAVGPVEPVVEQGGGQAIGVVAAVPGCEHGGRQAAMAGGTGGTVIGPGSGDVGAGGPGWAQGGGQAVTGAPSGRAQATAAIGGMAVERPALWAAPAVVVVGPAVVGGAAGGADASGAAPVAPAGAPPASGDADAAAGPDTVASDSTPVDCGAGDPVWAPATATSPATSTARGENRRLQLRCTEITSAPPAGKARTPSGARPQPVRLSHTSLAPGWWRLPGRINRGGEESRPLPPAG